MGDQGRSECWGHRRAQLQVTEMPYVHRTAGLLLPLAGLTASRRGTGFALEEEGSFIRFREPKEQIIRFRAVVSCPQWGCVKPVTSVWIYQSLTLSTMVIYKLRTQAGILCGYWLFHK